MYMRTWGFLLLILTSCNAVHTREEMPVSGEFGTPDQQLAYLNDRIKDNPDDHSLLYRKALLLEMNDSTGKALQVMETVLSGDPGNMRYQEFSAHLNHRAGNSDRTIEIVSDLEQLGHHSSSMKILASDSYLQQKRYAEALDVIDGSIALNPSYAPNYLWKGRILLASRDTVQAEYYFRKTLDMTSEDLESLDALVDILLHKEEPEQAYYFVNKLLETDRQNTGYLKRLAYVLKETGFLDSAQVLNRTLIRTDSGDVNLWMNQAEIFYSLSEFDSAFIYASYSRQLDQDLLKAQLMQARIFDKRREYFRSRNVYEAILQRDSTHSIARSELEYLERKIAYLQRTKEAEKRRDSLLLRPLKREGISN